MNVQTEGPQFDGQATERDRQTDRQRKQERQRERELTIKEQICAVKTQVSAVILVWQMQKIHNQLKRGKGWGKWTTHAAGQ